jgi:hypothetical protein
MTSRIKTSRPSSPKFSRTEWTENLRPESVLKYGVKISGVEDARVRTGR